MRQDFFGRFRVRLTTFVLSGLVGPLLYAAPDCAVKRVTVTRSPNNPLITLTSDPSLRNNVNGPSVIRVPEWVPNPLGKYYMYFANHNGKYIRLAYADNLHGPWTIHKPGTLALADAPILRGHIASPDVLVDDKRQEIWMYVHGPTTVMPKQHTIFSRSKNGLDFEAGDVVLGKAYFRVFPWQGAYYALSPKNGAFMRSDTGFSTFQPGPRIHWMRHGAVCIRDNRLLVFYSVAGREPPERILLATVELTPNWMDWQISLPIEVMRPEAEYEGTNYPNVKSRKGSAIEVQQLRDPCVFEEDGRLYLFYSIAGEMGIAMAELNLVYGDQ